MKAVYVRMSRDRTGEGVGIKRQETLCRRRATELGWDDSLHVYSDNDLSAYSGRPRPGYQQLVDDIRDGSVDGVVVYDLDRLHRRPVELEEFIELADRMGVALASVGGDVDLSTDNGRLYARIKGAVARAEMERKSTRQRAANLERAMRGERKVTSTRWFGYTRDLELDLDEAGAIRDGAQWVLDGVSLRQVAQRWNDAGFVTAGKGVPWSGELVSQTLRSHHLAGIVTYRRELLRDEDGHLVRGRWPAILDDDTWQSLQSVLTDPSRKWVTATGEQMLLSGLGVCGLCGEKIISGGRRGGRRYRCGGMGGHVNRLADPVNTFVRDVVVERLSRPDAADLLKPAMPDVDVSAIATESAELHQRIDGLADAYAEGAVTLTQLKRGTERMQQKLEELGRRVPRARAGVTTLSRMVTAKDPGEAWDELSTDVQRVVLGEIATVTMLPPGQGVRVVTDENVVVEWGR